MSKNEIGKLYNYYGKDVNILLVYPNLYNIGMSNLAFLNIYRVLNENPLISCERYFLPCSSNTSFDSIQYISDFDIILFTASYEKDISNILNFLKYNNYFSDSHKNPLLIIGGQLLKVHYDKFQDNFDIVFNGDFEVFYELLQIYLYIKSTIKDLNNVIMTKDGENSKGDNNLNPENAVNISKFINETFENKKIMLDVLSNNISFNKTEFLEYYNKITKYTEIMKKISIVKNYKTNIESDIEKNDDMDITNLNNRLYFHSKSISCYSNVTTNNTVFKNTFLIELTRGCPNMCKFCLSGYNTNYFKCASFDFIKKTIQELQTYNISKFGFVGLSILRYPFFKELCEYGIKNNLDFNFSSLEISELNEESIKLLNSVEQKTFTLAPENFSPKLLKILNKNIDLISIIDKIKLLNKYNVEFLKLYLIYGLDEETIDDLNLNINKIKEISLSFNGTLTISFNHLIPQPTTFFENRRILSKKIIKKKRVYLQKNLRNIKNLKIFFLDY